MYTLGIFVHFNVQHCLIRFTHRCHAHNDTRDLILELLSHFRKVSFNIIMYLLNINNRTKSNRHSLIK